jgi:hypothetical protein
VVASCGDGGAWWWCQLRCFSTSYLFFSLTCCLFSLAFSACSRTIQVRSRASTAFGTRHEGSALTLYEAMTGVVVSENNSQRYTLRVSSDLSESSDSHQAASHIDPAQCGTEGSSPSAKRRRRRELHVCPRSPPPPPSNC